jgi:hypothetical protein
MSESRGPLGAVRLDMCCTSVCFCCALRWAALARRAEAGPRHRQQLANRRDAVVQLMLLDPGVLHIDSVAKYAARARYTQLASVLVDIAERNRCPYTSAVDRLLDRCVTELSRALSRPRRSQSPLWMPSISRRSLAGSTARYGRCPHGGSFIVWRREAQSWARLRRSSPRQCSGVEAKRSRHAGSPSGYRLSYWCTTSALSLIHPPVAPPWNLPSTRTTFELAFIGATTVTYGWVKLLKPTTPSAPQNVLLSISVGGSPTPLTWMSMSTQALLLPVGASTEHSAV